MRYGVMLAALAALGFAAAAPLVQPLPARAATVAGTNCALFPPDSIWNTDISALPLAARNAAWLASMNAAGLNLHPDFGGSTYGIPYAVVDNTHGTRSFNFQYGSESDAGPYPFGPDIPVEAGSDAHALMVNRDTCTLYELGGVGYNGPGSAIAGAVFPLTSNALRPDTWTSTDAAGLPILPGLLRLDEIQAGAVRHAIRVTAAQTDRSYLWPARHFASTTADQNLPPMGARFRLKAGYNISGFSAPAQVILTAMQHYGLIVADNGSNWYFQGATNPGWPDPLIAELKTVPAAQFEAVDESSLMVARDSGAALESQLVLPALTNGAYGGYVTAAVIENTGLTAATIAVQYLDVAGTPVGSGDVMLSLPPRATWMVRQDNGHAFVAGGAGAAIVSSSEPVAVFVNEFAPNGADGSSYAALPATGAATLYAPAIASLAYGGYTTGIGLLNLANSAVTITIVYRDLNGSTVKTQTLAPVPARGYRGVYSGSAGQPTDANLPAGFAGTASISAGGAPLAAVVNETGPGGQFSTYGAVSAGSTTLFAPAVLNNAYGGYFTGMGLQNTTGSAGTVTVSYFDTAGQSSARTFNVAGNGYVSVYQGSPMDGPAPGAYTAKITSTVAVAAVVNEVAPTGGPSQQSTAYNAFSAGTGTVYLPLVENSGADGWSTGQGVMNSGPSATAVTVSYFDASTGTPVGTPQIRVLQPNAFWGLYQPAGGLPSGSRASAVVSADAKGQVVVICNQSAATTFMSYPGS